MGRILSRLDRDGERWLLLGLYAFVVLVIFIEVVRRFVLAYSSVWGEETARYAFIYLVWLGAAVGVRDRAHIRIDVLTHYLPPRGAGLLYIFGDLMTMLLAILALYWSIGPVQVSIEFGSVTDGLRIVKAWFLIAVPFGFLIIMIRLVQSLRRDIADFIAGRPVRASGRLFD